MIRFIGLSIGLFFIQILGLRIVADGNNEAVIFSMILFIDFILSFITTFVLNLIRRFSNKKDILFIILVCIVNMSLFFYTSYYHLQEITNELKYSLIICNFATLLFMIYSTIYMNKKIIHIP